MSTWIERGAARLALLHAGRVYARFRAELEHPDRSQQRTLSRILKLVRDGEYGRRLRLDRVRTVDDLRRAAPLVRYEDIRGVVARVMDGDTGALFHRRCRLLMYATSSGTTAAPKFIPVTREFAARYRRGWNTFGLKLLRDHPDAILRSILQSSGRYDESHAPSGVPCGAITGLMARDQKPIVRRFYAGDPRIAYIPEPAARYYALMRFAVARDVAFCITANPATLIRLADIADSAGEQLIRDIRDGVLTGDTQNTELMRDLSAGLRPDPARARALEKLRAKHGRLRPRHYWHISFLACWTGGSMGHYLGRLADWFGDVPVRDIGLLASEGRVSIPLDDGNPAGPLDLGAAVFEFIPSEHMDSPEPETLTATELEAGRTYGVVMTNDAGLIRYRLDDVVRVAGHVGSTPLVEFLYRAGRVASVAGEKLTEHHVTAAVRDTCARLGLRGFDFILAPVWSDPPFYQLSCTAATDARLCHEMDRALGEQNPEYLSRRKSLRLGDLMMRTLPDSAFTALDVRMMSERGSLAEQYKRPCLLTTPGEDAVFTEAFATS
jgi:hypothetical protein